MSEFFTKRHDSIRMIKANDDACRERMVRMYKGSPEHWVFQMCAPIGLGFAGLKDGRDFIHATAYLSLQDLHALRDAIDSQIASVEERTFDLTKAQLRALRAANDKGWHPYGGPEHRVALRLTELGLYHAGTGRPTEAGRAYLAGKA